MLRKISKQTFAYDVKKLSDGGHCNSYFVSPAEGLSALASIISQHPQMVESSRFVFVPGPADPGPGHILPRYYSFHSILHSVSPLLSSCKISQLLPRVTYIQVVVVGGVDSTIVSAAVL